MKTVLAWIPLTVLGTALAQGPLPQPQGGPQPQPPQQQRPRQMQPQQPQQPPDFSALKSYLNLTDGQIRQMQQAREKAARDAEEKNKTLRPQIEEKHRALADLLDKDNADATTVGKAMLEIRGLERQLHQAHEAVRNAEINVMSAEQKTKFKAIQDAAMLPQATRDAQRLGLVPGMGVGGQGSGVGGPRPGMQGPGRPGQPMGGPMQQPQGPPRQGGPEGDR